MARNDAVIALVNGRILLEDGFHDDSAVLLEGERIVAVLPADAERLAGVRCRNLRGGRLVPGFIDTQCNGGGGVLFNNDLSVAAIERIAIAHRQYGTTGFLPTLISDTPEIMRAAAAAVADAMKAGVPGVLGLHLEGPFLNVERKGVHDASKFRGPDADEIIALSKSHPGVTMLTLAPECASTDVITRMMRAGIILSAGHTAANFATMRAALAAGVRGVTHLFNAMTPLTNREPGCVGAALDDPYSWCGVIVDGHHVHPAALRVAIAAKPVGKIMLVTDAMPPVGSDDPQFVLDGRVIRCVDGVCTTDDGVLAGSALDMASAVRNSVEMLNLSLEESVRMASAYPAAFLGLQDVQGSIAVGQRADFVLLDDSLEVQETWIAGVDYPRPGGRAAAAPAGSR